MMRTLVTLTLTAILMPNAAAAVFAGQSDEPSQLLPKDLQNAPWLPKEVPSVVLPMPHLTGAFQTIDSRSTMAARQPGAEEVNPLFASGTVSPMSAVKKAMSAAAILLTAIATMIVANAMTAAIVVHKYRNATRR